jgi:hypothetical protein
MFRTVLRAALPAAFLLALLLPGTASAFTLNGCTLKLTALDAQGNSMGSATGGEVDATQQNPFVVDWNGTVSYVGTTGTQVIKHNSWSVSVWHIASPLRGGSPNDAGNKDGNGSVGVSANAPFRITGLYYVDGSISGDDGATCTGNGWFKLAGDPVGTIPFFAGVILLVVGLLLVVAALGGSAIAGLIGGIVVGLGAAVMLVIYSVAPLGEYTAVAVLGVGVVGGVALTFVARMRGKGKAIVV